jgi:hypothetical protein
VQQTTGLPRESLWNLWFGVCVPIGVAGDRGTVSWKGCFLRIFFSTNLVFLFSSLATLTFSWFKIFKKISNKKTKNADERCAALNSTEGKPNMAVDGTDRFLKQGCKGE